MAAEPVGRNFVGLILRGFAIKNTCLKRISVCKQSARMISSIENKNSDKKTIAICHMRATNDKEHNRQQVLDIVRRSKERLANIVFLPECCDYVGTDRTETLALAESLCGKTINFYKQIATDHNIWLSIGGFHELPANGSDKIYNSHVIIDNSGEIVAKYEKLHLYDVDTPEFKFRESAAVNGGRAIQMPFETPAGKLGLMICYDLRFPELSTILRKKGATVLTYPSAFACSTGRAHWEVLLRSRAIENQCFVVASAQVGFHNAKRESYGHAMVVDPWGKILAECDNANETDIAVVELDLTTITKVRQNMPCIEHRRNDIYTLLPIELRGSQCFTNNFIFEIHPIPMETIFYETEHSLAFTNIRCVVPGHVLVASRRQVHRMKDLRPHEIADFFQTVCKVQRMCDQFHRTSSSTVTVQDGEHAGQTVRHVHCHIMPRRPGDFQHNDDIYVELNRNDAIDTTKEARSLAEMAIEACDYRKAIQTKKDQ